MKQQSIKTEYNYTMISPTRIDLFISKQFPDLSRSKIQKMITNKQILVNNSPINPSFSVHSTFNLSMNFDYEKEIELRKEHNKMVKGVLFALLKI